MSNDDDRADILGNLRRAESLLAAEVERLTAERETAVRDLRAVVTALRALGESTSTGEPAPPWTPPARMSAPNGDTTADLVLAVLAHGPATLAEIAETPMLAGVNRSTIKSALQSLRRTGRAHNDGGHGFRVKWQASDP